MFHKKCAALLLLLALVAPPLAAQENAAANVFADLQSFVLSLLGQNESTEPAPLEAAPAAFAPMIIVNGPPTVAQSVAGEDPEVAPMIIVDG